MNAPPGTTSLLLADDHAIVRQGLLALLGIEPRFRIVGEARNGREAVQLAHALRPDVILMDIAMPELNGLDATRQILDADPAARVVILSAYSEFAYIERMIGAGAVGYLEKQSSAEVVIKAIGEVAQGRTYLSPSVRKRLQHLRNSHDRHGLLKYQSQRLTARESEVLQLVAEGRANKQIAALLTISIKTVEKHRQCLMNKLDIHDTASLTRHAISIGMVNAGPGPAPA